MNDVVRKPSHYQIADGIEAIDMIELIVNAYDLSPHEGYLLGNFLKYRLRLGDKDSVEQDLAKSNEYRQRLRESRSETNPGYSTCDGDCEACKSLVAEPRAMKLGPGMYPNYD